MSHDAAKGLPKVHVKTIKLVPAMNNSLEVRLDLIVKDIASNKGYSGLTGRLGSHKTLKWITRQKILKNLGFAIYQSTDGEISKNLPHAILLSLKNKEDILSGLMRTQAFALYAKTRASIRKNLQVVKISGEKVIKEFTTSINILNEKYYNYLNADGDKIYDIVFSVKFNLKRKPKNLTYFFVPYYKSANTNIVGNMTSERVIVNDSVQTTGTIYRLPSDADWPKYGARGDVYTGPIHVHNGVVMAGQRHTRKPHPALTREMVFNTKIHDYLKVDTLKGLPIDIFNVKDPITQRTLDNIVGNDNNIWTDIHLTRDKKHNSKFIFGVNVKKILKHYSRFAVKKDATPALALKTLKIKRRRVKEETSLNRLGGRNTRIVPFREDASEETIITLGSAAGTNKVNETKIGSIESILIGLDTELRGTDLRFFSVTDKSASNLSAGQYQYGVELTIQDDTDRVFRGILVTLQTSINTYKKYLDDAGGQYHQAHKRFNDEFIKQKGDMKDELSALNQYFIAYEAILGHAIDSRIPGVKQALVSMSCAMSGDPHGISLVLNLMELLYTKLMRLLNVKKRSNMDTKVKTHKNEITNLIEVKKYFDNKIFDANNSFNVGYEYLATENLTPVSAEQQSLPLSPTIGVKRIPGLYFMNRIKLENSKYFRSISLAQKLDRDGNNFGNLSTTALSYLSPTEIYIQGESVLAIEPSPKLEDASQYMHAVSDILALGSNPNSFDRRTNLPVKINSRSNLSPIDQKIKARLTGEISKRGVVVKPSSKSLAHHDEFADPKNRRLSQKRKKVRTAVMESVNDGNENARIIKESLRQDNFNPNDMLVALTDSTIKTERAVLAESSRSSIKGHNTIQMYNLSNPNGYWGKIKDVTRLDLPNQIKSLFVGSAARRNWLTTGTDLLSNPALSGLYMMNYVNLVRIEYLSGFEILGAGESMLKKPIWAMLNVAAYKANINKNILCRMTTYTNKAINIELPKSLKYPMYDEYFILSPEVIEDTELKIKISSIGLPRRGRPAQNQGARLLENIQPQIGSIKSEYINSTPSVGFDVGPVATQGAAGFDVGPMATQGAGMTTGGTTGGGY